MHAHHTGGVSHEGIQLLGKPAHIQVWVPRTSAEGLHRPGAHPEIRVHEPPPHLRRLPPGSPGEDPGGGHVGGTYLLPVESLEDGKDRVKVEFTLTAPGCGMGDFLREDVRQKLLSIPSVAEAEVEVVLDPPWHQSMMSDGARLQLGLM